MCVVKDAWQKKLVLKEITLNKKIKKLYNSWVIDKKKKKKQLSLKKKFLPVDINIK